MPGLYIVDFGDDDERARLHAQREAEHARICGRYARHLAKRAGIDEPTARRVVEVLFGRRDAEGRRCECGCHPRLSSQHGDGFDCPCTWDDGRRAERARQLEMFWESEAAAELRKQHRREEKAIADWLSGERGVDARRTTSTAPEQWEGSVDGHSFYFRGHYGFWRIELDLRETGHFARRVAGVAGDGTPVTEPEPVLAGDVIAEGVATQLGTTPSEHIAFIVQTIRDHLWAAQCDHSGALFYCPKCGHRMNAAS
jgi:hypothetical protein